MTSTIESAVDVPVSRLAHETQLQIAKYIGIQQFFLHRNTSLSHQYGQLSSILKNNKVAHDMLKLDQTHGTNSLRPPMSENMENEHELLAREQLYLAHQSGSPTYYLYEIEVDHEDECRIRAILEGGFLASYTYGPYKNDVRKVKLHRLRDRKSWSIEGSFNGICLTAKLLALTTMETLYTIRLDQLADVIALIDFDTQSINAAPDLDGRTVVGTGHLVAVYTDHVIIYDEHKKSLAHSACTMTAGMFAGTNLWMFADMDGLSITKLSWSGNIEDIWIISDPLIVKYVAQGHSRIPAIESTGLNDVCQLFPNIILDLENKKMVFGLEQYWMKLWKDRMYTTAADWYRVDSSEKISQPFALSTGMDMLNVGSFRADDEMRWYVLELDDQNIFVNDSVAARQMKLDNGSNQYKTVFEIFAFDSLDMFDDKVAEGARACLVRRTHGPTMYKRGREAIDWALLRGLS